MIIKAISILPLIVILINISVYSLGTANPTGSSNLINKVNSVENQWINYDGLLELDNDMVRSPFIPYDSEEDMLINKNAYVSYFTGDNFIKTELHEGNKSELQSVEEADGVILSFNKENKNGIKLISNGS